MRKNDLTPLIMWFILLAGIIVLSYIRPGRLINIWNEPLINPDTLFIFLYILWMSAEFVVSGKDAKTEGKKTIDYATCQIYGSSQALVILSALWFEPLWKQPGIEHIAGLIIFILGVSFRLWAIRTLGRFYSHKVRKVTEHKIIDSGPYRLIRHPAYSGMIIANAGVALYFFNPVTVCIFLLVMLPAIIFRIRIEEKMLFTIDGYAEFAQNRKRLFPGVW